MIDAIDELVARSKDHKRLHEFHRLHRKHPEVLDFMCLEIQARIDHGFGSFSYGDLWGYCRWKLILTKSTGANYMLNDHLTAWYGRAIAVLHPDFNGRAELRESEADDSFGLAFEPQQSADSRCGRTRRLTWSDGTPIERGWRPTLPHIPQPPANRRPDIHARPVSSEPTLRDIEPQP